MSSRRHRFVLAAAFACLGLACSQLAHAQEYISFSDVAPSYLTLTQSWNALGTDDRGRVYIIWTSTRDDHRDRAGRIYMAAFDWDTNCYLAAITP